MTTISLSDWTQSPEIVVGEDECRRLGDVARTQAGAADGHAEYLLYELDRARRVPDAQVPSDVVRLGSVVRYRDETGLERTAELALPEDANEAEGRLSVTSSQGSALFGLRAGQTITRPRPGQGSHRLKVLGVTPPGSDEPGPSAA